MTFVRYSQTQPDILGNLNFLGDKYAAGKSFGVLTKEVLAHLQEEFPTSRFKVAGDNTAGKRRLLIDIVDSDVDLSDPSVRNQLLSEVKDEAYRFNYDRSNYQTDLFVTGFTGDVRVSNVYWARRQRVTGTDLLTSSVNLSAFKKALQPGHILEIVKADEGVGNRHMVIEIATRIVTDDGKTGQGRYYWDFPISDAFLCDGTQIRIAKATTAKPDAYLLMNWIRP